MSKVVLGLDLGTYCGHATIMLKKDKGFLAISGTWDCSIRRDADSPSVRMEKFEKHLLMALIGGPEKVFYENVRRHKGTQAAHIYGAFKAKMMEVCDRLVVPYESLEVAEVKKYATGKGNASKEAMIAAVRGWGFILGHDDDTLVDDEADALAIARCGLECRT